ncbi:MAG: acyl-CoA thioesterase [Halapricum sp.]
MPTPSDTHIENRDRIQPNQTNNYDTAHGGIIMKIMDEVGAMSAMRFAGEPCVTAAVDGLDFKRPVPRGDIAVVTAWVFDAGETSVKVRLTAEREDPLTGERELTSESVFTFVAIDENSRPVSVPELTIESDLDEELRQRGLEAPE